jgi:hypothetical protein
MKLPNFALLYLNKAKSGDMLKYFIYLQTLLLGISCKSTLTQKDNAEQASRDNLKTRHVIILVVDGPRYSETWGDPSHQYIPHMANDLAKEGVIYTDFQNDGFTYTNSGHTALTTGYRQEIANDGEKVYPDHPSIFQYFLKYSGKDKSAAWVITTKDKLAILANTKDPAWADQYTPSTDCGVNGIGTGYREDKVTLESVKKILSRDHPNLVLINFKEPDASGHANNWKGYLQGIRDTDQYVWEIWNLINNDLVLKDKTTLFVTNDHGRHLDGIADGFISHGDGCRHINFFAAGPDFKKNMIIDTKHRQIDIPATVAKLLKFPMPSGEGKVLQDLFK